MEDALQVVLKRVKPTLAERKRLDRVMSDLIKRVDIVCKKLGIKAKPILVGSAARNTWLRSERDIDIFILFPEELPREEFERQGLAVAREAAGPKGREQFAEHPYVTAKIEDFDVDFVPCYDVADLGKIRSAVDRSPHHQRYMIERLSPELADEVLLVKQFMQGIGTYGAELKVRGFSGYLCELLVLRHGSFRKLVDAASGWAPGVIIDIERSYPDPAEARALFKGQPLIVIDPVDSSRNVAAAVSMRNFATFVRACQDFVRGPGEQFFFPKPVQRLSRRELSEALERRGTKLYYVAFETPPRVPDVLYPQLRKTERALVAALTREGFEVLRSDVWSDGRSIILLELSASRLPRVRVHPGPPISVEVRDFIEKHLPSKRRFAGPFVDSAGRLAFEVERKYTRAEQVLEKALMGRVAFGKHVSEALEKGYELYEGAEIIKLYRGEFADFLSEYLTLCLPWYR
jgi:tRNA nucleotidyltransferase (CCA-adding enzyme)